MHDLAIITTINSITPIKDKDRIVMANVENYNSIVAKDEFKVNDKVIYIMYDSILPEKPEFEFLRKRCWSEKYKGFRIRPMKMGGVVSEGLVLPMSILPEGNYKVGDIVTDVLGVRLYDPESEEIPTTEKKEKTFLKFLYKFKWFRSLSTAYRRKKKLRENERSKYDPWNKKSDEENIERCYNRIKNLDETYIVTEKVEGMAFSATMKHGKFKVFSHNKRVYSGPWWEYAEIRHLKTKMKKYCKNHFCDGIALAGELIGPKIQFNIYNRDSYELYLYGGYHSNGLPLSWDEIVSISKELDIPTVPYIREQKGVEDITSMLKDCEGNSVIYNVPREGLVYRSYDGETHFKVKSRAYKIWFEKKEPLD